MTENASLIEKRLGFHPGAFRGLIVNAQSAKYEYIVIGSGAGGGVVAARLAEAGHTVLLLEAGGDYKNLQGSGPVSKNRLPEDYEVPSFHPMSTENEALRWEFFVRHYSDQAQSERDDKFVKKEDGVLYPRAGTLGGCTAHNAMIMVYPNNSDWDYIANITGDRSWRHDNMRRYFQRLENCRHRWPYKLLYRLTGWNPTRHGFSGWLSIEKAIPKAALKDRDLVTILKKSVWAAFWEMASIWERLTWALRGQGDPNDWRLVKKDAFGVHYAPIHTHKHARNSTREFLLDVQRRHSDRLTIELNALATKVVFDDANRAIGVEYLKGERLYRAAWSPNKPDGKPHIEYVSREVILSGGAFNTPQLLMLSGIGPKDQLQKHGIKTRVDLPGVGRNLQDRYEVGVVNRLVEPWSVLKGATFTRDDPQCRQWARWRKGVYTTNGVALAVINRSVTERPLPDLFMFALIGRFKGYFPGYSEYAATGTNYLTWAILKAHTENHGGYVELKSADPLDPPYVNFKYFKEGTDKNGDDLQSVVDGIKFVRTMTAPVRDLIEEEELPGRQNNTDAELAQFVQDNAWGHHASCTCPIGPASDPMAVLDSSFRVYGTNNLRVVDASVFPKIPGMFIVSSVYMIGEKGADAILASAGHASVPDCTYGQGFWCKVRNALTCAGVGIAALAHAFKPVGQALLGVVAALAVALIAIVAASWFIFEPMSAQASIDETQTSGAITQVLTAKLKEQYKGGRLLRSTHPRANACLKANVTIDPVLPENLSEGFLRGKGNGEKTYQAVVRFSNAADHLSDDGARDFRGMAIKIVGVEGPKDQWLPDPGDEHGTQDILFIGHDAFFVGGPKQFLNFFEACQKGGGHCHPWKNPHVLWHLITHPRGAYNLIAGRKTYPTLNDIKWYSAAPFNLGPIQIVKYSAFPCALQAHYDKPGEEPDYLLRRLQNQLDPAHKGRLCLNLQAQVMTDPEAQPVENTLVPWDDEVARWQQLATIEIPAQTFSSYEQQDFCDRLAFNPWHGLKTHRPVGGINRTLRDVATNLQDVRFKTNGLQRVSAKELENFLKN